MGGLFSRFRRRKKEPTAYQPPYKTAEGWVLPHMGIVLTDFDAKIRVIAGEGAALPPEAREMLEEKIAEEANRKAWQDLRRRHEKSE